MAKRFLLLTLFFFITANAQRLPEGKLNSIRERTFDVLQYKANLEFEFAKGQVFGEATITFVPLRQIDSISLLARRFACEGGNAGSRRTCKVGF